MLKAHSFSGGNPEKRCSGYSLSGYSLSPHCIAPTVHHLGRKNLKGNGELALSHKHFLVLQNQLQIEPQSMVFLVSDMLCWVLLS